MKMPVTSATNVPPKISKYDEEIVVVPRAAFDPLLFSSFFTTQKSFATVEKIIITNMVCIKRKYAEEDETYKQIIPYFIFKHASTLFLMERAENAGEKRLKGMLTLGIGGHLSKEDAAGKSLEHWGMREFHEEVSFNDTVSFVPLGIVNDETTPVGRVHMGLVYLVEGSTPNISIKSELKNGNLTTLPSISNRYEYLEPWSKVCFDHLTKEIL